MKPTAIIAVFAVVTSLLVGCDSKESNHWELVAAQGGLLYRINKQTGEVALIVGTQIIKIEESQSVKKDSTALSRVKVWPAQVIKQLGDLQTGMKTNWRDGKLYYYFLATPYVGYIESERQKSDSNAYFFVRFYDSDGFEVLTLPIKLSAMVQGFDETGKAGAITASATADCTLETYDSLKACLVGWGGFHISP